MFDITAHVLFNVNSSIYSIKVYITHVIYLFTSRFTVQGSI